MDKYNIVYIDDDIDQELSKYFDRYFVKEQYEIDYNEIEYNPNDGYDSLLVDERIRNANIILIDSRLFSNGTVANKKIAGEELKLVLKKIYPFIEVIVITQNEIDLSLDIIAKFDNNHHGESAIEYYKRIIPGHINNAVNRIKQYRLLANRLLENNSWDEILTTRVLSTLNGNDEYEKLTKEDIDNLISAFQDIQEIIDGE